MFSCNAFDTHRHPTDGQCSTQIQPWPLHLTNAYSAVETHDVNKNSCNLCVVHWQCTEIAVPLGKSTDRIVQQINDSKICKNHDKCEFGQSFRKIIDASENPIYIHIYIHGLIDRIFNTATKPQKLFYLRVILSTCFSAIFSFLTYPKKSLMLFYVPVTEYIYIANQTDRIFQYRHIKETWSCQKHTCVNIC